MSMEAFVATCNTCRMCHILSVSLGGGMRTETKHSDGHARQKLPICFVDTHQVRDLHDAFLDTLRAGVG